MRETWVYLKAVWKGPINSKRLKIKGGEGLMMVYRVSVKLGEKYRD